MQQTMKHGIKKADSVYIFSLDLARVFVQQVGAGAFLSSALQEVSRRLIRGFWPHPDAYPDVEEFVRQFNGVVSSEVGDEALRLARRWERTALPEHAPATRMWLWNILLENLRRCWDEEQDSACVSIVPAQARLRIRYYLDHLHSLRSEVELTNEVMVSAWDTDAAGLCSEWFDGVSLVVQVISARAAQAFWSDIGMMLGTSEIEAVDAWGLAEARRQRMPRRYAHIPLAVQR